MDEPTPIAPQHLLSIIGITIAVVSCIVGLQLRASWWPHARIAAGLIAEWVRATFDRYVIFKWPTPEEWADRRPGTAPEDLLPDLLAELSYEDQLARGLHADRKLRDDGGTAYGTAEDYAAVMREVFRPGPRGYAYQTITLEGHSYTLVPEGRNVHSDALERPGNAPVPGAGEYSPDGPEYPTWTRDQWIRFLSRSRLQPAEGPPAEFAKAKIAAIVNMRAEDGIALVEAARGKPAAPASPGPQFERVAGNSYRRVGVQPLREEPL